MDSQARISASVVPDSQLDLPVWRLHGSPVLTWRKAGRALLVGGTVSLAKFKLMANSRSAGESAREW